MKVAYAHIVALATSRAVSSHSFTKENPTIRASRMKKLGHSGAPRLPTLIRTSYGAIVNNGR